CQDRVAAVGLTSTKAMIGVGAHREQDGVTTSALPHVGQDCGASDGFGGGDAMESVGREIGNAVMKQYDRRKLRALLHCVGIVCDDQGIGAVGSYLRDGVDGDGCNCDFREREAVVHLRSSWPNRRIDLQAWRSHNLHMSALRA